MGQAPGRVNAPSRAQPGARHGLQGNPRLPRSLVGQRLPAGFRDPIGRRAWRAPHRRRRLQRRRLRGRIARPGDNARGNFEAKISLAGARGLFAAPTERENTRCRATRTKPISSLRRSPMSRPAISWWRASPRIVPVGAGVPLLLMPSGWRPQPVGDSIFIAWKPSREATRAVHDAMPLLLEGEESDGVHVRSGIRPLRGRAGYPDPSSSRARRCRTPAAVAQHRRAFGGRRHVRVTRFQEADLIVAGATAIRG